MTYYFRTLFLTMVFAAPLYLLLRRPWRVGFRREAAMAVFWLFMAGLLVLALNGQYAPFRELWHRGMTRLETREYMNLRPFHTIRRFFHYTSSQNFAVNIVGNIVMFIPWGFGLVLLWKKNRSVLRLAALSLALTVFIEFVQLFIGRHVDVDDLLLNFIGGCLGGILWWVLKKPFPVLNTFGK